MTTVGFKFTKMSAEKKNVSEQNIRIENNVGITNVEESSVLDPKKSLLRFEFAFTCKYDPGLGNIELYGEIVEMFDKELSVKVLDSWKNEKKLHPDIMAKILNNVLSRANIEAIIISKELGLPSPIAMPKVEVKPKSELHEQGKINRNEVKTEAKEDNKAEAKKEEKPKKK